jgi:flagellar protein FliS
MNQQVSAYKDNAISTQSKGRIVVMLYDGAIKFLDQAVKALEENNIAEKGKYVAKAMDIINELDAVLDIEAGGEVAANLRNLYGFMRRHLQVGHLSNDVQTIREVRSLLNDLNEGWKAVAG